MTWRNRYTYRLLILGIGLPFAVWSVGDALFELAGGHTSVAGAVGLILGAACIYLHRALYANAQAHGFWEHVDTRTCECGHPVQLHPPELETICMLAHVPDEVAVRAGIHRCDCGGFVNRPAWWRRVLRKVSPV